MHLQAMPSTTSQHTAATGVRSFQLLRIGLDVIIYRLASSSVDQADAEQVSASLKVAVRLGQRIVEFLEALTVHDQGMFWMPCRWHCSSQADKGTD